MGEQIVARLKQFKSALQRRNLDEYRITKIVRASAGKGEWCVACNRDADDSAEWLRFVRNDGSVPFTLCPKCATRTAEKGA